MLYQTGQTSCFGDNGLGLNCAITQQDGEIRAGMTLPSPRFIDQDKQIIDKATGLIWRKNANLTGHPVTWNEALHAVKQLNLLDSYDFLFSSSKRRRATKCTFQGNGHRSPKSFIELQ